MSEFANLTDRRILVTGSSSGIGRAIAIECARAGADLILHGRHGEGRIQEVADEITALGRRVGVIPADLRDAEKRSKLADAAWELWGGLDACVLNAGADLLTGGDAKLDYSAKLDRLIEVDVRGTVALSRDLGMRMKSTGRGSLITIGWDQSDRGMEGESGELFSVAKNAIMGFTRSLALSLAPEVRINCIAPGWIRTAWGETASELWQARVLQETPLKRWGLPEDIARLARFLLSDEASYLTGQVMNANGGAVR